ncbi:MAG: multiple sugar-binding transporter, ATP-binding protein [Chitinophagaceae bacterium]|nr:multiple sugar-binding transporter, ATP-binding protein [Chitinophagaceae bacterium]
MSNKTVLRVENLRIVYGNVEQPAVQDVSFKVKAGECVAIIGESGSGKSTLLRAIACLQSCDEGKILVDDQLLPDPMQLLVKGYAGIRYVSQDTVLPRLRTVEDMLRYELRYFHAEEQTLLVDQYLDIFSLQEFRDRKDTELSGGQKQRVALSLALASDAGLLVLDEPFNQIDVITREKVKEQLFSYFRSSGKTLIMVTHDALDALPWSDKIVVLRDGHLLQVGTPEKVYEKPVDMYVASLFGPVQLLSKKQLNDLLHIEWPNRCRYAGIRYNDVEHQLSKTKNAIQVKWIRSYYAGKQYKWLLQDATGGEWMVYAANKEPSNKMIYLHFPLSQIFFFK